MRERRKKKKLKGKNFQITANDLCPGYSAPLLHLYWKESRNEQIKERWPAKKRRLAEMLPQPRSIVGLRNARLIWLEF